MIRNAKLLAPSIWRCRRGPLCGLVTALAWTGMLRGDTAGHAFKDQLAAEAAALLPEEQRVAAAPAPSADPADAAVLGRWTDLIAWEPHIPVHAATLPDGRLLTFASNQRTTFPDGPQFTYAAIWNPATGEFTEINNESHDMFCGGMSLQPDGRLLVNGGNGINGTTAYASLFDWRTDQWTRVQTMADGRWYNTSVALPNGEVLTAGGNSGGNANGTLEQWNASTGWRSMSGIPWAPVSNPPIANAIETNWHPFFLVAPDGRVAHFGPHHDVHFLDPTGTGALTSTGVTLPGTHFPKQGSWAMYEEGQIVVAGGLTAINNGVVVNQAYKVDLRGSAPVVTAIGPMVHARSFSNAVVLPNGEVMVVGGTNVGEFFSDEGSIFAPEIWNPVSETWREVANIAAPRNYHSIALLLADGRVWSAGGGLSGDPLTDHRDAQIFTPPQLFNADGSTAIRPVISAAPQRIEPNITFSVSASNDVDYFSVIRLSSVTHSVNTDQRHLRLSHTSSSAGVYEVSTPDSIHVLTPGYWMLYAVNTSGVWSVSHMLQVTNETLPVVTNPGPQQAVRGDAVSLPIQASTGSGALSFSASGLPLGLSIDGSTGVISGTLTAQPGTYQSTILVTANTQVTSIHLNWIVVLPNLGSGQITREWWTEMTGTAVTDLTNNAAYPANPNGRDLLGEFATPRDWDDNTGQRLRGFLHVPTSGAYQFFIASDDQSSLRLSPSSDPGGATEIASVPDYTDPEAYGWYSQQTSASITLQAGTRYYIEALVKEGGGGDHLNVAWRKPGDSAPTTIGGTYLSPYLPVEHPAVTWSFDESSWDGTAGEVASTTTSRFSAAGTALNGATTSITHPALPGNPGTFRSGLFDGIDQSAVVPYQAALNPNDFTVAAWVHSDAATGTARCVLSSRDDSLATPRGYSLWITSAGTWQLRTTTEASALSGGAVVPGQWTHVAATFRTTSVSGAVRTGLRRLFINGTPVAESTGAYRPNTTRPLVVGAAGNPAVAFFQGAIDEVTLHHQPLSPADILLLRDLRHNVAGGQSPTVTPPGAQSHPLNAVVSLPIQAIDPEGAPLTFTATELPPGLSIAPASGVITGTATTTGLYTPVITVADGSSPPTSVSFSWEITERLALGALSSPPQALGGDASFTATASHGVNPRFRWSFGDGTPDTDWLTTTDITHHYTAPGRYQVTLTATDDNGLLITRRFYQAIHAPLTANAPTHSGSLLYERRASASDRLWCVNPDHDSVSVFDAVTQLRLAEIPVGQSPRSIARAPTGDLWVANVESATLSVINSATLSVTSTIPLPRGSQPFGVVFDTTHGWVALEGTAEVLRIDAISGTIATTLPLTSPVRHLSLSGDHSRLYASRFVTPPVPGENTAAPQLSGAGGQIVVIHPATQTIAQTILVQPSAAQDTETSSRGLPNYLGAAVISPDGLSAWVPSKQDNLQRGVYRDRNALNHENTVRAIVSRLDLTTQAEDLASRVDIDNAGMPSAVAFDPWGMYVFTALEASREIAVLDAWSRQEVIRFPAGRAPQGLTLSPDGFTLYVHNFMDRSVTVHDVSGILQGGNEAPPMLATWSSVSSERLSAQILQGKKLFYDAKDPRLANQEYMSCASCHHDGKQDGRVWDLTGSGEGLRNTITLRGHGNQGRLHWTGNFDEVQDFEAQIRNLAGGTGLIPSGTPHPPLGSANAGRSADLDALAAYVTSLTRESDSPFRSPGGALTANAAAGQQLFRSLNCARCHGGSEFTLSALGVLTDIGTLTSASGTRLGQSLTGVDIPTLRGVWNTAPYLHNGSAATLSDAISAHAGVALDAADLDQLVAFVRSIDSQPAFAPEPFAVSLSTPTANITAPFTVTATFNAAPIGVDPSDVMVTNGTASDFSGGSTLFSWTVHPIGTGRVTIHIPPAAASDATGMPNLKSNLLDLRYTAIVQAAGVTGEYYTGKNFETLTLTRTDPNIEFLWTGAPDPLLPADGFSVRWTGFLVAPTTGSYTFTTRSDDGVRLYIDGSLRISNWTNHGEEWDDTSLTLTAGTPVPFTMEFYDNTSDAMARLWWSGPGVAFSPVPTSAFQTTLAGPEETYPPTLDAWQASPYGPNPSLPDYDHWPDLLEYALGTSPTSAIHPTRCGLKLEPHPDGFTDAYIIVPSPITDIHYELEHSPDLIHWDPIEVEPVITPETLETTRLTWPAITPFVRLRVTLMP